MTAIEYLRMHADITSALGVLHDQLAEYRAACDTLRSPDGDRLTFEEACAEYADFTVICSQISEVLNARRASIRQTVRQLPQPYQAIIMLRYIRGYSWAQISAATKYSRQHVHRLHGHALQLVDNLLKTNA